MGTDTLGLIFTAIGCSAGATWLLRSAIAGVERALAKHVAEDEAVHAKVIRMEEGLRQQRKGRK